MSDTVSIVVGWDDDQDCAYAYADPSGDGADERDMSFNALVPAELWTAYEDAWKAFAAARDAVVDASGYDAENCRMAELCPEWKGEDYSGRTWWQVILTASGSEKEWPVRDANLWHADTEQEAVASIAALPDEFYAQATGHHFVKLTRDRLRVERGGMAGYVSNCHRCGWDRTEHMA